MNDYTPIELSYIVSVYFNQQDYSHLTNLLKRYATFDKELLKRIQFIIIDDGSPIPIHFTEDLGINYQIFRIKKDIPWNNGGARNLGVTYAPSQKILLTDCDHFFSEELFRIMLKSKIPHKSIYKFRREEENGTRKHSAFNIFYTSKSIFFAALGYDEEFSGHYGYEDTLFIELQERIGNKPKKLTRRHRLVSIKVDREKSYHSLVRDTSHNQILLERKRELLKTKNPFLSHSRIFLNFDYEKVQEAWIN